MQKLLALLIMITGLLSCGNGGTPPDETSTGSGREEKMVTKRREDGTISSINPVDEKGYVHGVKVNFYEDGKTIHSRVTYVHGRKHGPAIWYYKSGQVYEHTGFHQGQKHGVTRRYYESGQLMEELSFEQGKELPGKKKYNRQGELTGGN
ncbi:MAG: hypothetical protein EHM46_04305 [Bacteroidetes bacterium]|nr:MAG: hypothetical protein EHM46_04305 [Bacteroidota bacterium]